MKKTWTVLRMGGVELEVTAYEVEASSQWVVFKDAQGVPLAVFSWSSIDGCYIKSALAKPKETPPS